MQFLSSIGSRIGGAMVSDPFRALINTTRLSGAAAVTFGLIHGYHQHRAGQCAIQTHENAEKARAAFGGGTVGGPLANVSGQPLLFSSGLEGREPHPVKKTVRQLNDALAQHKKTGCKAFEEYRNEVNGLVNRIATQENRVQRELIVKLATLNDQLNEGDFKTAILALLTEARKQGLNTTELRALMLGTKDEDGNHTVDNTSLTGLFDGFPGNFPADGDLSIASLGSFIDEQHKALKSDETTRTQIDAIFSVEENSLLNRAVAGLKESVDGVAERAGKMERWNGMNKTEKTFAILSQDSPFRVAILSTLTGVGLLLAARLFDYLREPVVVVPVGCPPVEVQVQCHCPPPIDSTGVSG